MHRVIGRAGRVGNSLFIRGALPAVAVVVFSGMRVLTSYLSLYNFNRFANKNSNFNKEIVLWVAFFTLIFGQQLITVL